MDNQKQLNIDPAVAYNQLLTRYAEVSSEAVLKQVALDEQAKQLAQIQGQLDAALSEPCASECCKAPGAATA